MNGMSRIIRTATLIVSGFMLIFGCYVMSQAHASHGTGFAGGVIAALALMLPVLAFGRRVADRVLRPARLLIPLMAGACMMFLALTCADLYWRDHYGRWLIGPGEAQSYFSAGLMTPLNIIFCAAAALMLVIVFACLNNAAREKGND